MSRPLSSLLVSLVICLGAGWAGSLLTRPAIPVWYAELTKPEWTPSNWVISTVWRTLFALMGVALWMAWQAALRTPRPTRPAFIAFGIQLLLNIGWSAIFFGLKSPGAAFAEILLLWTAIAVTVVLFWRIRPAAGVFLLPYLAWVTFAAALNATVWRLNTP